MSDRLLGLVCLVIGTALVGGALRIEVGFISDPIGPRTFPVIIGSALALSSLWILFRPDANPEWPPARRALELAGALVLMIVYALILQSTGFVIATALAAGILSWRMGTTPSRAVLTGLSISVGIYVIFHLVLGLSLARGPLGF